MPAGFERVAWFGPGPEETYADRQRGTRGPPQRERWTRSGPEYSKPQENGNKTDVRWLAVTNRGGVGLLAVGMPYLSAAVRHYAHEDIWNARHSYELTEARDVLNLDDRQMGVGGDDSWGALAHEPYRLPAKGVQLSFPAAAFRHGSRRRTRALAKKAPAELPR